MVENEKGVKCDSGLMSVASPLQSNISKREENVIELGDLSNSGKVAHESNNSAVSTSKIHSLFSVFTAYDMRTRIELSFFVSVTIIIFAIAIKYFLDQSITTLVPFQSISQCSTSQQMYSFSEQHVEYSYPMALKFIDYSNGISSPGTAEANFAASWDSCGGNSLNASSFGLSAGEQLTKFVPLEVALLDSLSGSYNASIASSDGCFQVTCGFNYTFRYYIQTQKQLQSFINNTLIEIIPYNSNDVLTYDNGSLVLGNSQLMVSISQTKNSVFAQCVVGIAGTLDYVLSESNSVSSSGTYLCTTKTTAFQSLSSSLSLCLSFIGVSRIYFMLKSFYMKAPKAVSS